MSWDLQSTKRQCGHEQVLERMVLDVFDFRTLHYAKDPTLNMRAPINGAQKVRVFLRDQLVDPNHPEYGYDVVPDPLRVQENYLFSKVMFRRPVRLISPLIQVSYITMAGFCLQCDATSTVNDWAASPSGKLLHVTQVPKLAQQALKYVLASKNPFNQSIVCHLKDHLHKKFNAVVSTQDIASEVTRVLQVYKQVQSAQRTVQNMDALEMLRDIKTVSAQRDVTDPTLLYVSIQVTPYGQTQPIPMNLALKAAN